jgi:K+-dependent Na+/Ca+ exchanger-like protein
MACSDDEDLTVPQWVSDGGIFILVFAVYASLWGISLVCEDYFVPALNKVCHNYNLKGDVAGATLMAMGNSAPLLFTSIISVFVTRSSLGLGTAIGSAIFNHLCICGACVIYSQEGKIALDWRVLFRDCLFYLLSLIMLVWSLKGSFAEAVIHLRDHSQNKGCLTIRWEASLALVGAYIVYVLICSMHERVVSVCCPIRPHKHFSHRRKILMDIWRLLSGSRSVDPRESEWTVMHADEGHNLPLLTDHGDSALSFLAESAPKVKSPTPAVDSAGLRREDWNSNDDVIDEKESDIDSESCFSSDLTLDGSDEHNKRDGGGHMYTSFLRPPGQPAAAPLSGGRYECWLLKQSSFYSKLRMSSRKWQLRFFVLDDSGFRYCRNASDSDHIRHINIFEASAVNIASDQGTEMASLRDSSSRPAGGDAGEFMFHVVTPKKAYVLRALTADVFRRLVYLLRKRVAVYKNYPVALRHSMASLQGGSRATPHVTQTLDPSADDKRRQLDFVDDTYSQRSGEGDSDNEFDDAVDVWDELAMYTDATALAPTGPCANCRDKMKAKLALKVVGTVSKILNQSTRPLKWLIRKTIPRVLVDDDYAQRALDNDHLLHDAGDEEEYLPRRHSKERFNQCSRPSLFTTVIACIAWMGILSYILTISAEIAGHQFGVSSAVTGLTVAAAGTSFPSLLSSVISAYQGQGDMAMSNAFGSNVFSVLIGLGLPWLLAIIAAGGAPFDDIQDDGVVASVVLLLILLSTFYIALFCTGFVFYQLMGYSMLFLYIVFLVYIFLFVTATGGTI